MNGQPSRSQASALLVVIARYDDPAYESLNEAPKATQALAEVLARGGYTRAHPKLQKGGDNASIILTLGKWLRTAARGDTVVLYWAGHGKREGDGHWPIADVSCNRLRSRIEKGSGGRVLQSAD